ncbi:hypothetical protein H0I29_08705 [Polaribacter sp. R2A056_3_33]|uniref:hypothetical protein n=1 Tax=Polaribacter sp. R2A056_3_33 TaxID=2745563 RepID=UPI001C4FD057|nr:hypothetical protein [Polaribacter sp. R2A056_3_33]QXP72127.1 hypothetical protein H0I29_08705 [Polaribacter sp. R2A056_3_33]
MKVYNQFENISNNLDPYQVTALKESIYKATDKAKEDAEKDNYLAIEKIKEENDISLINKRILLWKTNFLKAKSSDYFLFSKYFNKFFSTSEEERLSKIALVFFTVFKENTFYTFEEFQKNLCEEIYIYKKCELQYEFGLNLIEAANRDASNIIKLPPIENFELDSFKQLLELNNKCTKREAIIEEHYKAEAKRITLLLDNANKKYIKEINVLEDEVCELKDVLSNHKFDLDFLKKQNKELIEYNLKREPVYVMQFDNTVWGDNYPALKILYKFLFEYYSIGFNWSFFAYIMTNESKDVMNLGLIKGSFNKAETGYLLFKIQIFFNNSISLNYFDWLSKKITINNNKILKKFYSDYIRNSKVDLTNLIRVKLMDDLYDSLKKSYIKT